MTGRRALLRRIGAATATGVTASLAGCSLPFLGGGGVSGSVTVNAYNDALEIEGFEHEVVPLAEVEGRLDEREGTFRPDDVAGTGNETATETPAKATATDDREAFLVTGRMQNLTGESIPGADGGARALRVTGRFHAGDERVDSYTDYFLDGIQATQRRRFLLFTERSVGGISRYEIVIQ